MRPGWFSATDEATSDETLPPIPYGSMWPDDVHWMPLLAKRPFLGRADFDTDRFGVTSMVVWRPFDAVVVYDKYEGTFTTSPANTLVFCERAFK